MSSTTIRIRRPIHDTLKALSDDCGESAALCEAVRSITRERLTRRLGRASPMTMFAVEDVLRILMGL